jgi:hypothetical protein
MSKAFERRLAAIEAKVKQKSGVSVPSPCGPLTNVAAMLDALGAGRPFSRLHWPSAPPASRSTEPADPTSPGARVAERLESLRRKLAEDPGLDDAFEANRKAMIKAIEAENRAGERRERQRAKRHRRAERKAEVARQAVVDATSA